MKVENRALYDAKYIKFKNIMSISIPYCVFHGVRGREMFCTRYLFKIQWNFHYMEREREKKIETFY